MVAIVAKCKEIKNLAQKYQFGDNYWRKKIAGENFCLPLERHLPLKVIDSCRPCITSHNSVADESNLNMMPHTLLTSVSWSMHAQA